MKKKKIFDYIVELNDGRKLGFSTDDLDPKNFDISLQEWFEDDYFEIKNINKWENVVAVRPQNTCEVWMNALYPFKTKPVSEVKSYQDAINGLQYYGFNDWYFEIITRDEAFESED